MTEQRGLNGLQAPIRHAEAFALSAAQTCFGSPSISPVWGLSLDRLISQQILQLSVIFLLEKKQILPRSLGMPLNSRDHLMARLRETSFKSRFPAGWQIVQYAHCAGF